MKEIWSLLFSAYYLVETHISTLWVSCPAVMNLVKEQLRSVRTAAVAKLESGSCTSLYWVNSLKTNQISGSPPPPLLCNHKHLADAVLWCLHSIYMWILIPAWYLCKPAWSASLRGNESLLRYVFIACGLLNEHI